MHQPNRLQKVKVKCPLARKTYNLVEGASYDTIIHKGEEEVVNVPDANGQEVYIMSRVHEPHSVWLSSNEYEPV